MDEQQLKHQRQVWDDWAIADPMWAILSAPDRKNGRWTSEEFFASGVADVTALMQELADRGIAATPGRSLDFGCGVGRLTQALADVFDRCDGVDISETMVNLAREFNHHGDRCRYHVNVADDLSLFGDGAFDFVYSTIVLQHNPPEAARAYIAEFVRLLAPGGVAVFDMPAKFTERVLPADSHLATLTFVDILENLEPAHTRAVKVRVENGSPHDWPAGTALRMGNHWRRPDGGLVTLDDGRTAFNQGLPSGESEVISLEVNSPSTPGDYVLEVDLVEEGICWFADRGSPTVTSKVTIRATSGGHGLLQRLFRRPEDPPAAAPVEAVDPEAYTMNGLPRETVEQTVVGAGADVMAVRPSESAGPHWETYRYFARRPETR